VYFVLLCRSKRHRREIEDDCEEEDEDDIYNNVPVEMSSQSIASLCVSQSDFEHALTVCRPSSMRDVVEVPKVRWDDVGGSEKLKQSLVETIDYPLNYPHLFNKFGLAPSSGVLLYGPPGCGKTLMAKAIATGLCS
jgi:transitional endoplasmic reticulum ATPase